MIKTRTYFMFFLLIFLIQTESRANNIVFYDMDISTRLESGDILFKDKLKVEFDSSTFKFYLNKTLTINSLQYQNRILEQVKKEKDPKHENMLLYIYEVPKELVGKSGDLDAEIQGHYEKVKLEGQNFSDDNGTYVNDDSALFLDGTGWYPNLPDQDKLFTYKMLINVPKGKEVIATGDLEGSKETGRFLFKRKEPIDEITFLVGNYFVSDLKVGKVKLMVYISKEDPELAQTYLSAMKEHLLRLESEIGPFPYDHMALIAPVYSIGVNAPEMLLIGQSILKIPNILQTSLGHEMTHNYWGSSVYLESEIGDWSEGLTMFMSDFQYFAKKNGLASVRLDSLKHYAKAIKNQPEKSLKMVGMSDEERPFRYDKAALVFSMVEEMIGKEKFRNALQAFYQEKKFQKANWNDLRKSFEKVSGLSLTEFFDQWVNRAGVPSLRLVNNEVQKVKDGYEVKVTLSSEPGFKLNIPIEIKTESATVKKTVSLDKSSQSFVLQTTSRPVSLSIDPEYSIIRKLLPEELPPDIASVLDNQSEIGIIFSGNMTSEEKAPYEALLKALGVKYKVVKEVSAVSDKGILLGPPGENGLMGGWKPVDAPWVWEKTSLGIKDGKISSGKDTAVMAWYGPNGPKQTLIWVMGYSGDGLTSLGKRLPYYKFGSYVFLRDGKPVLRGDWELSHNPMVVQFPSGPSK